jgi:hypothetical protein
MELLASSMKKMLFSLLLLVFFCCNNQKDQKTSSPASDSSSAELKNKNQKNHFFKEDTLTTEEKIFLKKISGENEFIMLSNKVERFFSENDSIPRINKLIFRKDSLIEKGYVYFNLNFYGKISDVDIKYNYSLGQAVKKHT